MFIKNKYILRSSFWAGVEPIRRSAFNALDPSVKIEKTMHSIQKCISY